MVIKTVIDPNGKTPVYSTSGAACCDIFAAEDVIVPARGRVLVSTDLKMAIPEGFEAKIRGRSGLAANAGIVAFEGTIDSDHRDEIQVLLFNFSDEEAFLAKGHRIAQMSFGSCFRPFFDITTELTATDRKGGFGSTGK